MFLRRLTFMEVVVDSWIPKTHSCEVIKLHQEFDDHKIPNFMHFTPYYNFFKYWSFHFFRFLHLRTFPTFRLWSPCSVVLNIIGKLYLLLQV